MTKQSASLVSPSYTGVAFLFSWIYLIFYANTAGIEAAAPISLMSSGYMSSAISMVLVILIIAFAPFEKTKLLTNSTVKVSTAIFISCGSALLITGGFISNLALIIAGGVITGVSSGVLAMQWVFVYKRVSIKVAICSFPALMAMSVCICMTLMYFPPMVMLACVVVMPIVSEFMFHWVRLELPPKVEIETGPQNQPLNYLMVLSPICLFFLASGFLDFFSLESKYTFVFYALAALIPLVIALAFVYIVNRRDIVATFIVPLCFLVVAFVPMFSLHSYLPAAQFISIGELGLEVVVFIAVVAFSEFFDLGSLKVYALARAGMVAFSSAGWYIAAAVNRTSSSLAYYQLSLVVAFVGIEALTICLIVAIVKAQKREKASDPEVQDRETELITENAVARKMAVMPPVQAATAIPAESAEARFDRHCREISEEYDLSKRETDVLELLARGYAATRIQQELFIAAGTVNYHTRNIYSKLGVHSKQEIIDLVSKD